MPDSVCSHLAQFRSLSLLRRAPVAVVFHVDFREAMAGTGMVQGETGIAVLFARPSSLRSGVNQKDKNKFKTPRTCGVFLFLLLLPTQNAESLAV